MQKISEIMTPDVTFLSPDSYVQEAAKMMRDEDIGSIPICNGKRLVGMVTDRDIVIRAIADGKKPDDCKVSDVMSSEVTWCFDDQMVDEVLQQMAEQQIRRIPVVSRNKELCGIVSLGDMATRQDEHIDQTLEKISGSTSRRSESGQSAPATRH